VSTSLRITRLRAEAAVLLAEGKSQECLTKATEGLAALDLVQNMGLKVLERDWLQDIINQIKQ
jgi:hypothetical protein